MSKRKELKSTATIRAFLRLLKQKGYYIRIRDVGREETFSREVSDEELVAKWEEKERTPRR